MNIKRIIAALGAGALLSAAGVLGVAASASAATPHETIVQPHGTPPACGPYLQKVITPGVHHDAVTHDEYQYSQVTTVWTVEHKEIQPGDNQVVLDWLNSIGGTDEGNGWWQIPDATISAVNFNPLSVATTGNVDVQFYGAPHAIVPYQITGIDLSLTEPTFGIAQAGETIYWTSTGFTLDQAQAEWTQTTPDAPWALFDTRTITDHPAYTTLPKVSFVKKNAGACAPPIPAAQQCASTDDAWYSEDVAPTTDAAGLEFVGQADAVDWYHPVTGNLQGLGDSSLSFENVSGYQPSFTIVLNPHTALTYANLVAEWYMNGGSPDTAGTFDIHADSTLFWTNKIDAAAPGGQSDPQPLSFFIQLWPDNQLTSLGAHLGMNSPETTHSTLTGITGCVTDSFVPVVTPPAGGGSTPTPTPTPTVTPSATPIPAAAASDTGSLAHTGSDITLPIAAGIVVLGLGSILLTVRLITRRRRV